MKKSLAAAALALILLAFAFLPSCAPKAAPPEAAPLGAAPSLQPLAADNSATAIQMAANERSGQNIGEIAMIAYDSHSPALASNGGKNPEIEKINDAIRNGALRRYNAFRAKNGNGWVEAKSYPFTSERYLQIVMTYVEHPSRGSDGEIFSYNFDKQENLAISLETVLKEQGLDGEGAFLKKAKSLFRPQAKGLKMAFAVPKGFLVPKGGGAAEILFEGTLAKAGESPWVHFFCMSLAKGEVRQLNSEILFPPQEMDRTSPPLFYEAGDVEIADPAEQQLSPTK
jgi:hypothetical protein